MSNEQTGDKKPVQYILLDTNIVQLLGHPQIGSQLENYLIQHINNGFGLGISNISVAELTRNLSEDKERLALGYLYIFPRFYVLETTLLAAGRLSSIYSQTGVNVKNEDKIKIPTDHIELADLIIAATSVLNGTLIMTTNIADFPNPYFYLLAEKMFIYDAKKSKSCIYTQILSPNVNLIIDMFNRRFKEIKK